MNKQNESVRDYRRYLNSDPIPSDFKDVQKELSEMLEAKTEEPKKHQSSSSQHQSSYQNRPNSGKTAFDDMKKVIKFVFTLDHIFLLWLYIFRILIQDNPIFRISIKQILILNHQMVLGQGQDLIIIITPNQIPQSSNLLMIDLSHGVIILKKVY